MRSGRGLRQQVIDRDLTAVDVLPSRALTGGVSAEHLVDLPALVLRPELDSCLSDLDVLGFPLDAYEVEALEGGGAAR